MELRRDTENGSQRKPCLCSLANMDDDDVVMHNADCSFCDGGLLETAFLEDNESDSWACLMVGDVESKLDEIGGVKVRTEGKQTVRCQEDVDVQFKSEEKVNVKQVVLENKEAQLDKYIAALQRNNARLLQRFHEVEEDKKRAERRDEDWKRKRRTSVTTSRRAYHSVSLVEKQRKKSRRRNRRH